jgi:hypothetical protein
MALGASFVFGADEDDRFWLSVPEAEEHVFRQLTTLFKQELRANEVCVPSDNASLISLEPDWLTWNDGTVYKIALGIYEDDAFERMPILADALEDAGCDNADILAHCRGDGPHVRGCWVVDLLLGKS